jgi:dienelactone hydrolase
MRLRDAAAGLALGLAAVGCASSLSGPSMATTTPNGTSEQIPFELVRPDGAGPFPAVVWMHSCAGLVRGARHVEDWTRRLLKMGYVVAIPDSFSERGYPSGVCGNGALVTAETRAGDAYAALRSLENRSDVIADHIGLMGHSHGGWTVLAAMDESIVARVRDGARHGFAAAVAFYPECAAGSWTRAYRAAGPLLILSGELDDWTPAEPCQRLADVARAQGQPVSIVVYPGAYHSFDTYNPVMRIPEARRGRGATIGGDNGAREDSIKQVEAFFARYLTR